MFKIARIGDKINGGIIIDITVKNNRNHVLAPTWELVMGLKNKKISWEEYKRKYIELLEKRLLTRKDEFYNIVKLAKRTDVILVCYCKDEKYCHRSLAKQFLENLS